MRRNRRQIRGTVVENFAAKLERLARFLLTLGGMGRGGWVRGAPGRVVVVVDEYGCSVCAAMGIDRGYGVVVLVVTSDHGDPGSRLELEVTWRRWSTWWSSGRCCRGRCEWTGWSLLAVVVM